MTKSIHSLTSPVPMSVAATAASRSSRVCVTISSRRRSNRSTSVPAYGPKTSSGRNVQAVISPRSTPLPVRRSTSQDIATPWVIVPDAEKTWAKNHGRYSGDSSERKACRSPGRSVLSAENAIYDDNNQPKQGYINPNSS